MLKWLYDTLEVFRFALQQYHDRPFEVAAAGYQHPQRTDKPEVNVVSTQELGQLVKGT